MNVFFHFCCRILECTDLYGCNGNGTFSDPYVSVTVQGPLSRYLLKLIVLKYESVLNLTFLPFVLLIFPELECFDLKVIGDHHCHYHCQDLLSTYQERCRYRKTSCMCIKTLNVYTSRFTFHY